MGPLLVAPEKNIIDYSKWVGYSGRIRLDWPSLNAHWVYLNNLYDKLVTRGPPSNPQTRTSTCPYHPSHSPQLKDNYVIGSARQGKFKWKALSRQLKITWAVVRRRFSFTWVQAKALERLQSHKYPGGTTTKLMS